MMAFKTKRILSILLALTLSLSLIPAAFAETSVSDSYTDFPTGWSKPAMEAAVKNGLILGYADGLIHPKDVLTRASMAAIIERAFGAKTYADISQFTDVKSGAWYYDSLSKAYQMRAIYGTSDTTLSPNDNITREQVFTILARVLVLSNEDTSSLNRFNDANDISSWAKNGMAALVERGYINGDEKGNVNPKKEITREEFAQLMYMSIRTYITKAGEYTKDLEGITVIRVGGVTLKALKATSDIVIGDGVLTDSVKFEKVDIENRLVARGGKITIKNTTIPGRVVVNNYNGTTYFNNYRDEKVFEGLVENTPAEFLRRYGGGGGGSSSPITIRFYEGPVAKDESLMDDPFTINSGEKIPDGKIPDIGSRVYNGFKRNETIASVYGELNIDDIHKVAPSYWYKDASGKFVEFEGTERFTEDTNIYLIYKKFGVILSFDKTQYPNSKPISMSAAYNDETRLMDTTKDLLTSGRNLLGKALTPSLEGKVEIPGYDRLTNLVINNLAKTGIIDTNKNVKIMTVKIPMGKFLNESTVEKMLEEEIKLIVNDPDEVDTLFGMLNIGELAEHMDLSELIHHMSNVDVAEAISKPENRQTVVNFIYGDLDNDNEEVLSLLLDYIHETGNYPDFGGGFDPSLIPDSVLHGLVKDYVMDDANETDVKEYIDKFADYITESYIASHREKLDHILEVVDLHGYIDAEFVKYYISTLNGDEKDKFAKDVLVAVTESDMFDGLMEDLNSGEEEIIITSENKSLLKSVTLFLDGFNYDTFLTISDKAIVDTLITIVGDAFLRDVIDNTIADYNAGLKDKIAALETTGENQEYTTNVPVTVNPMQALVNLYNVAKDEAVDQLTKRNDLTRYNENDYLKYLVEHDVIANLFNGDATQATGDLTGYSLKGVMDYYDYMLSLVTVADDALVWYGDNLTEDQIDAVYEAVVAKGFKVHEKLNKLLKDYSETGALPAQLESLINRVSKLNELLTRFEPQIKKVINKYLESSINKKLENGEIPAEDKIQSAIDVLLGTEDPTFTIDAIYEIFYQYDDTMQAKLKKLVESGKLEKAIEKFENTDLGELLGGKGLPQNLIEKIEQIKNNGKVEGAIDSVYNLILLIADYGIEPFRIEEDVETVIDAYEVNIRGVKLTIRRFYE